ncbi:flavoprotein [Mesobacillus subterraneus]|uniref:Flavoprotein n=1 Tax=Mesobacillus subterraneus TaxID=285983 RepID=A0A3R9DR77_9BACI|nr:flavoprotein [Mesobacillus subterraneus]RSD25419.1 flavoprotein [Mesobacillus subterraneus]
MPSFNSFHNKYLDAWRNSSLQELTPMISRDYQAREIAEGKISDFGYEESIRGWEQGFTFVKENKAEWELKEIARIPLREHETMSVIFAKLVINGKTLKTGNLFFQTFIYDFGWKLARSYIEAGIPSSQMENNSLMSIPGKSF